MDEVWKPVQGYEGMYEVSSRGRVRSLDRFVKSKGDGVALCHGRELKQIARTGGYLDVSLNKNGRHKIIRVHRLVAAAFCDRPKGCDQVNHKNEIRTDNRAENLEWCDCKYNNNYNGRPKRIAAKLGVPVIGIGKDGSTIRFNSITEAEKTLGTSNISRCLRRVRGHHTAGGYRWEYA